MRAGACAPRSCTLSAPSSKCARLRRTFHFLFPPPSLLPFPPHAAAIRCGAANFYSFIFEKKSENAAARNTHRSTRIAQHNLCNTTRVTWPRRELCLYALHPKAVVVAAHAARVAVRDKQQSNTVRRGSSRCGALTAAPFRCSLAVCTATTASASNIKAWYTVKAATSQPRARTHFTSI